MMSLLWAAVVVGLEYGGLDDLSCVKQEDKQAVNI